MKKIWIVIGFLLLISSACTPNTPTESNQPQSENRCGDNVCDGPENINNCPEDCAQTVPGQNAPENEDETAEKTESSSETPRENSSGTNTAFVIVNLYYDQEAIEGDCGSDVWTVEGGFPPCYWWGEYYEVAMTQMLSLSENGDGNWQIKPQKTGNGYYQEAKAWDDNQRCCSPTLVEGENFVFDAQGSYADGSISLSYTANPVYYWEFENRPDNCPGAELFCPSGNGNAPHNRLLYAWADAMNGTYQDLSSNLYATGETGIYRNEFNGTSNPIPNDSVNIRGSIEFQCIEADQDYNDENVYKTTKCPWE